MRPAVSSHRGLTAGFSSPVLPFSSLLRIALDLSLTPAIYWECGVPRYRPPTRGLTNLITSPGR